MEQRALPGGDGAAQGAWAPARRFRFSGGRRRWGAAIALCGAVLFLGVADGFPLVVLPLGVLLLGTATRRHVGWLVFAALVWAVALVPGGNELSTLSRGWALLLGGAFLVATLLRPRWSVFSRSLAAVAGAVGAAAATLAAVGGWASFDATMAGHFRSVAAFTAAQMGARFPDSGWAAGVGSMSGRLAELQGLLFPGLLALQSLAALALAWWVYARSRPARGVRPPLRPIREFRFNDALVWLLLAGLLMVLLPAGEAVARVGYNLLVFMAALYVLRGVAVFVFLARGAPTATSVVLGVLATLFLYPLVFTAALLVGLGDTWLDVRGRVMAATTRA